MNVVLGIGGGIAAYKAAELARALMERGVSVQVVMTAAAQEFVRPLTFAALTSRKVITGLFASQAGEDTLASAVEHIGVADNADLLVVAPATADLLAKFANGLADDFLSPLYLAFPGPVVLAPAMNTRMWQHPATRRNTETLRGRGHTIVEPDEGLLACGTVGPGRLAEPERIAEVVMGVLHPRRDLEGETVLVTAGPTEEPIDPVRFISNRSSGKMGYAIAEEAVDRGARVILVSGPVSLAAPSGVTLVAVRTAAEMRTAVLDRLAEATIVIKAAAVADYTVPEPAPQKIKKTGERLELELTRTVDILAHVSASMPRPFVVGFAAETHAVEHHARAKLLAKNLDLIAANEVGHSKAFDCDHNALLVLWRGGGRIELPSASKCELANALTGLIVERFQEQLRERLGKSAPARELREG